MILLCIDSKNTCQSKYLSTKFTLSKIFDNDTIYWLGKQTQIPKFKIDRIGKVINPNESYSTQWSGY